MLQGFFFGRSDRFDSECRAVAPLLWDHASGELAESAPEAARVAEHIARCPRCKARRDAFRAAARALDAHAATPPNGIPDRPGDWAGVQSRLAAASRAEAPSRPPSLRPVLAGGLALALGTAVCGAGIYRARVRNAAMEQERQAAIVASVTAAKQQAAAAAPGVPTPATADPMAFRMESILPADDSVEMTADPCWRGVPQGRTAYPVIVRMRNRTDKALPADLIARESGTGRSYVRHLTLPADGAVHRCFLYTAISDLNYSPALEVTLSGGFGTREASVPRNYGSVPVIGLVSERGGSLTPLPIRGKKPSTPTCYTRPETAPDRAVGYSGISALVLGNGAARLNPDQWTAIREWIVSGGSLIALPAAADALPESLWQGQAPPRAEMIPASDAPPFWGREMRRQPLGLGTVLTLDFDPTTDDYRRRGDEVNRFWAKAIRAAAPVVLASGLQRAAVSMNPAFRSWYEQSGAGENGDPFRVPLPPVPSVLYLFLSYFVLAVPVTFVVLRRTGRMNLAWCTGPLLAAGFGGAVYLFTAPLYRTPLSRRTTGALVAVAGESAARFTGYTELYFPHGGTYALPFQGAETIEPWIWTASRTDQATPSTLQTRDTGRDVTVPALNVGNLSFQRFRHVEQVAWGGGVTADLRLTPEGLVVGSVRNATGRAMDEVEIDLPQAAGAHLGWVSRLRYGVSLGRLGPGVTPVRQRVAWYKDTELRRIQNMAAAETSPYTNRYSGDTPLILSQSEPVTPILTARTSGEPFGPRIGRWVGGEDTTRVIVALPPLRGGDSATAPAAAPATKKEARP